MQALKALVIFMAILIVAGITTVAVTIYKRATHPIEIPPVRPPIAMAPPEASGSAAPPGPAEQGFGTRVVAIPTGAVIQRVTAEGNRLLVEMMLANGTPQVMVIDLKDGSVLGILEFASAPPSSSTPSSASPAPSSPPSSPPSSTPGEAPSSGAGDSPAPSPSGRPQSPAQSLPQSPP